MSDNAQMIWATGYECAIGTMKAMLRGRLEAYPTVREEDEQRVRAFRDIMIDLESLDAVAKSLRESAL